MDTEREVMEDRSPWTGEKVKDSDRLMLITLHDSPYPVREQAEAFLLGGGRVLQYRAKGVAREQMLREATALASLCADFEATLIINDFVEVAKIVDADGVHLGLDDAPPQRARVALGGEAIIGATVARLVSIARSAGVNVPIFAIGGIDDMDIRDVLNAGCMGVAVSASIALASDPQRTTTRFLERINRNVR